MTGDTWTAYRPLELVRCPSCKRGIGQFGEWMITAVRIHPRGVGAPPTTKWGFSHRCQKCSTQLDIRIEPTERPTP